MSFRYDLTMEIDVVISYVNNNDEIWRKTFIDYCIQINEKTKEKIEYLTSIGVLKD